MAKSTARVTIDRIPVACFAPALTEEKLAEYKQLVQGLGRGPVKDAMASCLKAIETWWELPESKRDDISRFETVHRGKKVTYPVTPLEVDHMDDDNQTGALWDVVPYDWELKAMQEQVFNTIPESDKRIRDAAFHMLWYVMELCNSREPLTQDVLPSGEALAAAPDFVPTRSSANSAAAPTPAALPDERNRKGRTTK